MVAYPFSSRFYRQWLWESDDEAPLERGELRALAFAETVP